MADVSTETRDYHGRWTAVGGGAPEGVPVSEHLIKLFGKDIDNPNLFAIKEAAERGVWNIYSVGEKTDKWSGDKVTTLAIEPKASDIPDTWKVFSEGEHTTAYDPTMAHVEVMTPTHSAVIPNTPGQSAFPLQEGTASKFYRGMSFEEYQNAVTTGKIASSGAYNIGEHEKGLTYFSTDPLQAASYANGFAPWPFIATPGHPAVVVEVDNKGMDTTVDPHRPTEVGVKGDIPMSAVTRAFIGSPIMIDSGRMDVKQGMGKPPSTGSGVSPTNSLVWNQASIVPGGANDKPPPLQEGASVIVRTKEGPLIQVDDIKNEEYARRVALAATDVAKREGFDPAKIVVTDHDEDFQLNNTTYKKAGVAQFNGVVTLFSKQMAGSQVMDVTTHEIMHQKFREFEHDYQAERSQVMKLPTTGNYRTDPMKPDGMLREPYATQFPIYQQYTKLVEGTNEDPNLRARMAKEDGCTPYSTDWWQAVGNRTARPEQAINETLAEMAMLRNRPNGSSDAGPPTFKTKAKQYTPWSNEGTFKPQTSPDWDALYKAVTAHWDNNAQKRAHRAEWGM
ncbi:MAG: hypothetical protein ACLPTZ_05285 [Beijerinckiaceae bacterium]